MTLQIFNVAHGFCALLRGSNGNVALFDCGHDDAGFRPSIYLPQQGIRTIHKLHLSHFDADHVSDLAALRNACGIQIMVRNRSMASHLIRGEKLKSGPLTNGLEHALYLTETYTEPVTVDPDFPGVAITTFNNVYPTFSDMNNLSLVTVVRMLGVGIIIPGDLERAGWLKLLEQQAFRDELRQVNIFIASHHGRENGYCKEVFDHCSPHIVIISDTAKQYESQEHCYDSHASGVPWSNGSRRFVLTTRSDGHITITATGSGGFTIQTGASYPPL